MSWCPISTAPKRAVDVRVRMADGTVHDHAHWASDLSGEEQPPFQGWFVPVTDSNGRVTHNAGIDEPAEWQPRFRLPAFITFTGVDARTDLNRAYELSSLRYPIEWGVLLSPTRQGQEPRYPDGDTLSRIWSSRLSFSAHLCGQYARDVMEGRSPKVPADLFYCKRIQVNHPDPDPLKIRSFAKAWNCMISSVAQTRGDAFPEYVKGCSWLFDRSGGTGTQPSGWPPHPGDGQLVGYAGGIEPGNVLDVLNRINSTGPYWIDMESGVRTDDWLDLDKVEAVCRAVYGDRS